MIARAAFTALFALVLSQPAAAQALGLDGLYKTASEEESVSYDLKITTGDKVHEYAVTYTLKAKGVLSVTVLTERTLKQDGKKMKGGRQVETRFRIEKTLEKQLKANKRAEGWRNVNVTELKVVGKEKVKVAGKEIECSKISFKYSGQIDNRDVTAEETIWYSDKVKVHRIARAVAKYDLALPAGNVRQTVELNCVKN